MTLVYATARRGNQSPVMFSHIYYFRKSGRLIGPIAVSFIFPVCIASKIATRRKFYRLPSLTVARRDDGRMETLRATRCQREREREGASERASDSGRGRVRGKGRGSSSGQRQRQQQQSPRLLSCVRRCEESAHRGQRSLADRSNARALTDDESAATTWGTTVRCVSSARAISVRSRRRPKRDRAPAMTGLTRAS